MSENSEMSLDEVLSSIKKMVTDEEPPVLELTDMITEDGSIVNVKKDNADSKNSDMGSFLKLIQENSEKEEKNKPVSDREKKTSPASPRSVPEKGATSGNSLKNKDIVLSELVKELITPLLRDWLNQNLPSIVSKAVEEEVKKLLHKN